MNDQIPALWHSPSVDQPIPVLLHALRLECADTGQFLAHVVVDSDEHPNYVRGQQLTLNSDDVSVMESALSSWAIRFMPLPDFPASAKMTEWRRGKYEIYFMNWLRGFA